jgi:hypothetical protein
MEKDTNNSRSSLILSSAILSTWNFWLLFEDQIESLFIFFSVSRASENFLINCGIYA